MRKQEKYRGFIRFGFSLIIWGALTAIWAFVWINYYADDIILPFYRRGHWLMAGVYGFLLLFFNLFYGGYRIGYYKRGDVAYSGILALILCNVITYLQASLIAREIVSLKTILLMTLIQGVILVIWAMVAHAVYIKVFPPRKLLMVYGGGKLAASLLEKMHGYPEHYAVRETIDAAQGIPAILDKISGYDGVILFDMPPASRNRVLKFCFECGIRTYTTPKISDILIRGAVDIKLFDTPLFLNRNAGLSLGQQAAKRTVDLGFSAIALVVTLPLIWMVALAVKLYDGGPVFYKQRRLTTHGRQFWLYKFRSMVVDAEGENGARLSPVGDNRITRVGRFIRVFRLDELPQLWNILKGDMSIVGPRPERPELASQHIEDMPEFAYRLKVKAGLTGLAQIVGRYNTSAYDKLKLDLMYITNYSLFWDFKLMLMTVKVLFSLQSTQGVKSAEAEPPKIDVRVK